MPAYGRADKRPVDSASPEVAGVPAVAGLAQKPSLRSQLSPVLESPVRRGDRADEGARLESVCAATPYRGFESRPLR